MAPVVWGGGAETLRGPERGVTRPGKQASDFRSRRGQTAVPSLSGRPAHLSLACGRLCPADPMALERQVTGEIGWCWSLSPPPVFWISENKVGLSGNHLGLLRTPRPFPQMPRKGPEPRWQQTAVKTEAPPTAYLWALVLQLAKNLLSRRLMSPPRSPPEKGLARSTSIRHDAQSEGSLHIGALTQDGADHFKSSKPASDTEEWSGE